MSKVFLYLIILGLWVLIYFLILYILRGVGSDGGEKRPQIENEKSLSNTQASKKRETRDRAKDLSELIKDLEKLWGRK